MPLYDPDDLPQLGLEAPAFDVKPPGPPPTWGDLFDAAARDNSVISILSDVHQNTVSADFEEVDGYEPGDSDYAGYEDDAAAIAMARSPAQLGYIKGRIDRERHAHEVLSEGGWAGITAALGMGALDPVNLLPVGGTLAKSVQTGRRVWDTAKLGARAAGVSTLAEEALLQQTQITRGVDQSIANVAFATLFGGALGAGIGALTAPRAVELMNAFADDLDWARAGGAAMGPEGRYVSPQAVGAAAVDPRTMADLDFVPAAGFERLGTGGRATIVDSPAARLMSYSSLALRKIASALVDPQLRVRGDEIGIVGVVGGPAETRIKLWDGNLWKGLSAFDDAFVRYRRGRDRRLFDITGIAFTDIKANPNYLTRPQFSERVAKAMRQGDQDAIPEVAQAAQALRLHVFEPLKRAAIELGLLPENVDVTTALSYLMRQYDLDVIARRRPEFEQIIVDWLADLRRNARRADPEQLKTWQRDHDQAQADLARFKEADIVGAARMQAQQAGGDLVNARGGLRRLEAEGASPEALAAQRALVKQAEAAYGAARWTLLQRVRGFADAERTLARTSSALDQAKMAAIDDDEVLSNIAGQIVDGLMGLPTGHVIDAIPLQRGPLKERTLNIPDKLIEDFLVNDVEQLATTYVRKMATDVELKRAFPVDTLDLKHGMEDVKFDYRRLRDQVTANNELTDAARQTRLAQLASEEREALRDLQDVVARMRGLYGMPENPSGFWTTAGRWARTWNYLRLGGGFSLGSLSDMGSILATHGLKRVLGDYVAPTIRNWKLAKLSGDEAALAGTATDIVLGSRVNAFTSMFEEGRSRLKGIEAGLQWAGRNFGLVNAMSLTTDFNKRLAAIIGQKRTLQAAELLAQGKLAKGEELTRLTQLGIDVHTAARIVDQFKRHGQIDGPAWWANTEAWDDVEARNAFRAAMTAEVDRVVPTPGQDKPFWMSEEYGRVLGQFKSFTLVSLARVLTAGLQRRDAVFVEGLVWMVLLGMLQTYLRHVVAGTVDETPDDAEWWIAQGVDRSGALGFISEANAVSERVLGIGAMSALGIDQPSRYRSLELGDIVGGPMFSLAEDALAGVGIVSREGLEAAGLRDDDRKSGLTRATIKRFRRMIPLQNLFYLRWLFDQVNVSDAMGLPPERKRPVAKEPQAAVQ